MALLISDVRRGAFLPGNGVGFVSGEGRAESGEYFMGLVGPAGGERRREGGLFRRGVEEDTASGACSFRRSGRDFAELRTGLIALCKGRLINWERAFAGKGALEWERAVVIGVRFCV